MATYSLVHWLFSSFKMDSIYLLFITDYVDHARFMFCWKCLKGDRMLLGSEIGEREHLPMLSLEILIAQLVSLKQVVICG